MIAYNKIFFREVLSHLREWLKRAANDKSGYRPYRSLGPHITLGAQKKLVPQPPGGGMTPRKSFFSSADKVDLLARPACCVCIDDMIFRCSGMSASKRDGRSTARRMWTCGPSTSFTRCVSDACHDRDAPLFFFLWSPLFHFRSLRHVLLNPKTRTI